MHKFQKATALRPSRIRHRPHAAAEAHEPTEPTIVLPNTTAVVGIEHPPPLEHPATSRSGNGKRYTLQGRVSQRNYVTANAMRAMRKYHDGAQGNGKISRRFTEGRFAGIYPKLLGHFGGKINRG